MSQEIRNVVRNITAQNFSEIDKMLSALCKTGGWELFNTHYIAMEKKDGSHNVMWVLVREVDAEGKPVSVEEAKRGRGRPANI